MIERKCPVCTAVVNYNNTLVAHCMFFQREIVRYKCNDCGLIFGPLDIIDLSANELDKQYEIVYRSSSETYNTADYFNFLRLKPEKNKIYLSIACGDNPKYFSTIRQAGYNIIGNDISLKVQNEFLYKDLSLCPNKKFDGVISHNYLEHVQDPLTFFSKVNGYINLGDMMIHSTPCIEYIYEDTALHLYFYTQKALTIIAAKTGFELVEIEKFSLKQFDSVALDNCTTIYDNLPIKSGHEAYRAVFRKTKEVS
jgi:hypothetical protein